MAGHDNGYKLLFSHAEMVADLLRGFVREAWVQDLDFSSLQRVSAGYVSDDLRHRESDVVWRLRWGREERWLYVYLLLEFQSKVDPFMAVRVMTYLGLLYQDLIRQRHLTPSRKLPPVLPLVLYNGNATWGAALDVAELVEAVPGGLERYRPRLRYCLLDEGRIPSSELELRNLAAALFRLERSHGPEDVHQVLHALLEWLHGPEQSPLRRAFAAWLAQVFLPLRLPGVDIPIVAELQEVIAVLADNVKPWTEQWKEEGFEEGLGKGIREESERSLEQVRGTLLKALESRFGPLPENVKRRVAEIHSLAELTELSFRAGAASSLDSLGLG